MSEPHSPSGRFNLLDIAKRDNLLLTPKYKKFVTAQTLPSKRRQDNVMSIKHINKSPTTPITSGKFDLRRMAALGGLRQKWDVSKQDTQYQKEQKVNNHTKTGGNDLQYDDAEELLDRPGVIAGAKPKNKDNKDKMHENMNYNLSPITSPKSTKSSARKQDYKNNKDTKTYEDDNASIPTSAKIGNRTIDLKNYELLDRSDWSRIGKGSRIAYEKKDGKIVEGHVLHALYANKKDENDENEYMLMEAYNFKPGKKGTFKWSLAYKDVKNLWAHPGMFHMMDKNRDLRKKFEDSLDTKRTVRNPKSNSSNEPSIDNESINRLKNKVDNNISNLNELMQRHEELTRKNDKLESDMENITRFLTRKYSAQFQQPQVFQQPYYSGVQGNNMQSQVL